MSEKGKEDALTKTYDFMLWSFPQIARFPKTHKFILGDRIQNHLLDVHERLIEARFTRDKKPILARVNLSLEQLRHLFRLAKDLRLINLKKYEHTARELDAIGRFVGGWIKSLEGRRA
ncbi:MAG: diversity-generating retroelement protein Avd [Desulfococcaceae bacterium]